MQINKTLKMCIKTTVKIELIQSNKINVFIELRVEAESLDKMLQAQ